MKKIAIIFPYLRDNGICKVPAVHSIMFTEEGYKVDLLVRDSQVTYKYCGNLIDLNVKTYSGIKKILTYIKFFFAVRKQKKVGNYDYVISHTPHCDLINILTKKKEKVITTIHVNVEKKYSLVAKMVLKYILRHSDKVITVSKYIKENMSARFKQFKDKFLCIYNPVDFSEVLEMSEDTIPNHIEGDYILSAGRLENQKGQWHLIKAFSQLKETFPLLKLVILGEGSLKDSLVHLTKELGIQDRVFFEGFQNNPYRYMSNAKIFVLSSLYEGFPLVVLEAMSTGCPIISFDCKSGPREIISPESAIYSDIDDYKKVSDYGILLPEYGTTEGINSINISVGEKDLADKISYLLNDNSQLEHYKRQSIDRVKVLSKKDIMKEWTMLFKVI